MTVDFDFYETKGAFANQDKYHVRVVDHETVDTECLIERIQQGTTLTVHDLKGAISALSQEISRNLQNGNKVHLKGLGYFSLSIDGDIVTDKNDQLRLKNPHVRTVKFQPEEQLLKQMSHLSYSCQNHRGRHSQQLDEQMIHDIIGKLLAAKPFFTARDFFAAAHVTPSTGYRILNQWTATGRLVNLGTAKNKLYALPQTKKEE